MVKDVGVFEAKTSLSALLELVAGGHGIFITKHGKRVAELRAVKAPRKKAKFGCARGRGFRMAPDFDAPLDCFKEYSP
jgi:antitoxin (DNA-binding transcriptional repressor) of toxin-antitoxin stability system